MDIHGAALILQVMQSSTGDPQGPWWATEGATSWPTTACRRRWLVRSWGTAA